LARAPAESACRGVRIGTVDELVQLLVVPIAATFRIETARLRRYRQAVTSTAKS
jgi:hypothetical protein